MMKKQMEFRKVATIILLVLLTGLSACRTCNCPAYSRDEPVNPAMQTYGPAETDLKVEMENSSY